MTILETIANNPNAGLSFEARQAIKSALVSKGKTKGNIKSSCPAGYGPDTAAWCALMMVANPYKVSIGRIMFFMNEARDIYNEIDRWTDQHHELYPYIASCDKDRRSLSAMGAW